MDNQTKIIFVLLALMVILTGIFVLKITGVIKPAERKIEEPKEKTVEIAKENAYSSKYEDYSYTSYKKSFKYKLSRFIYLHKTEIEIGLFILILAISIGIGKFYAKLGMPSWCVYMQYLAPFLSFTTSIPVIGGFLSLIIAILELVTLSHFFTSVGMSKWWPLCPIIALILMIISLYYGVGWLFYNSPAHTISLYSYYIALLLFAIFIIAYIIANVKVGLKLDKGTAWIIGLVLVPYIVQPIIGYMPDRMVFEE